MMTTNVAIVEIQWAGVFFVDARRSSPNVEFESRATTIDRVTRSTKDTLVLEG